MKHTTAFRTATKVLEKFMKGKGNDSHKEHVPVECACAVFFTGYSSLYLSSFNYGARASITTISEVLKRITLRATFE